TVPYPAHGIGAWHKQGIREIPVRHKVFYSAECSYICSSGRVGLLSSSIIGIRSVDAPVTQNTISVKVHSRNADIAFKPIGALSQICKKIMRQRGMWYRGILRRRSIRATGYIGDHN